MIHGRKRFVTVLTGLATAAVVGIVPTTPTYADPDIDDVQAKVDRLYHQAEKANERYLDAKMELADLDKQLRRLKTDQKRQQTKLDQARGQVEDSIVRQYQGANLSAVGEVVVSDDPSAFLSQLSTMSAYNNLQTQRFKKFSTELEALEIRREAAQKQADKIAKVKAKLGKDKRIVDDKLDEAEELLGDLEAEEREQFMPPSRGDQPLPNVPASGRAKVAVDYALAQVGDSYVYGAEGPDAFDCSGLTSAAWAQAGVALSRSSSSQMGDGAPVSQSDLMPGDLVFYYDPVSHVAMYIGGGQIVHAANPSKGVRIDPIDLMPYSGAVRPG